MDWFGTITVYRAIAAVVVIFIVLILTALQIQSTSVERIRQNDLLLFSVALMASPLSGIIAGSYTSGLLVLPWLLFGVAINLSSYVLVSLVLKLIGVIRFQLQKSKNTDRENAL